MNNEPMSSEQEKRRYRRYPNQVISLEVARPGIAGIIRANPDGDCLNFSRTGMQFQCAQTMKAGAPLLLDLAIGDLVVHELPAEVVSSHQNEDKSWCHGVRFCLEKVRKQKQALYRKLLQIEDRLKLFEKYPD
jgi:hypothetical protein